jgi:hypothetical protein
MAWLTTVEKSGTPQPNPVGFAIQPLLGHAPLD